MSRLAISKLIAIAVGIICILFAYNYNKSATYQISGSIYGTYWQLISTEYITDALKKEIEEELSRIDYIASNYKKTSEISRINSAPVNQIIDVSQEMYSLLSFAENLNQVTDGYYDITLGGLVIENGFGPTDAMTENALPTSNKRFDFVSANAIVKNDNFQFDLSSIAKGYAVDAISKILLQADRNNFLIDIGGEIIVNGSKHGAPWVIGIQNPSSINNQSVVQILRTGFLAIATSGEYRNTKLNDSGQIISHTFIPSTKKSIENKSFSVTVVSEKSSMIADAWATAMNVMGPQKGITLANQEGIAAMYIMPEENNIIKSNFWNYSD
ncbi:FAD:protein FMN transferase [Gammaproteobacteria bacterium]|nr:FAD:protein FMN transferase [Gammaproteobacteria bacterium]